MGMLVGGLCIHSPVLATTHRTAQKAAEMHTLVLFCCTGHRAESGCLQDCTTAVQTSLPGNGGHAYTHGSTWIQLEASWENGQIVLPFMARRMRETWLLYFPWSLQQPPSFLSWGLVPCQPLIVEGYRPGLHCTLQLQLPQPPPHRGISGLSEERTLKKALECLSRGSRGEECVQP